MRSLRSRSQALEENFTRVLKRVISRISPIHLQLYDGVRVYKASVFHAINF